MISQGVNSNSFQDDCIYGLPNRWGKIQSTPLKFSEIEKLHPRAALLRQPWLLPAPGMSIGFWLRNHGCMCCAEWLSAIKFCSWVFPHILSPFLVDWKCYVDNMLIWQLINIDSFINPTNNGHHFTIPNHPLHRFWVIPTTLLRAEASESILVKHDWLTPRDWKGGGVFFTTWTSSLEISIPSNLRW